MTQELEMSCTEFEELISDYLDGRLEPAARSRFGSHALQCRHCRSLLDDVKNKLNGFETDYEPGRGSDLDTVLEMIPESQTVLGCDGFRSLITEFLDGYVPAHVYHKFAQHSDDCAECSKVLTDVVYAVAACHSVHTYEDYDVPVSLTDRLVEACSVPAEYKVTGRIPALCRNGLAGVRGRFEGFLKGVTVSRLVTASGLIVAFLTLLAIGSPNLALKEVYDKAQTRAGDLISQGVGIYSHKQVVEARVQQVGSDIAEVWKSLNAPSSTDPKDVGSPGGRP